MAYTNHTTNYNLPQYVGTDKPSYLNDFNGAMSTIDGQMKTNANGVSANASSIGNLEDLTTSEKTTLVGAINEVNGGDSRIGNLSDLTTTEKTTLVGAINEVDGNCDTNTSNIGTLSSLTTTETSNLVGAINEVDGHADTNASNIGTLSSLTTTEKGSVVGAVNEVDANIKKFNMSVIKKYETTGTGSDVAPTGCSIQAINMTIARDTTGSIYKCYGVVYITPSADGTWVKLENTGIYLPQGTTKYRILPAGFVWKQSASTGGDYVYMDVYDNYIELHFDASTNRQTVVEYYMPCIYFNTDFGDEIVNP